MSIAKKCDRCGTLYEFYGDNKPDKINGISPLYIGPTGGTWNHGLFDLCPACMEEFKKFYKMKEAAKEENNDGHK